MSFNLKLPAFILGTALVCGSAIVVDAQTGEPAGGGAAGAASDLNNPSVGMGLGKIIPEAPHQGGYILDPRRSSVLTVRP